MSQPSTVPVQGQKSTGYRLRVFTPASRWLWAAIALLTVLSEVMPQPLMPPVPFYAILAAKLSCFVVLGYLAPLAFWRFNALNRGILLATISAACVELLQGQLRHGHNFHWYELAVKLALILLGFALALDARYELQISLGPFRIHLIDEHPGRQRSERFKK